MSNKLTGKLLVLWEKTSIFTLTLVAVSTYTTYLGLRKSLLKDIELGEKATELLAIAAGIAILCAMLWVWDFLREKISENGFTKLWTFATICWLISLFGFSTMFSIVGFSAGTAMEKEFDMGISKWARQINEHQNSNSSNFAQVESQIAPLARSYTDLSDREAQEGRLTGMRGYGEVAACYIQIGSAFGAVVETYREKAANMDEKYQEAQDEIAKLRKALENWKGIERTERVFRAGGDKISSVLASITLPDVRPSLETSLRSVACSSGEIRDIQREKIEAAKATIASLEIQVPEMGDNDFTLGEINKPLRAIFVHAEDIMDGWAISILFDYLVILTLLGAWDEFRKKKKGLLSVQSKLENKREAIRTEEGKLHALKEKVRLWGLSDPDKLVELQAYLDEANAELEDLRIKALELEDIEMREEVLQEDLARLKREIQAGNIESRDASSQNVDLRTRLNEVLAELAECERIRAEAIEIGKTLDETVAERDRYIADLEATQVDFDKYKEEARNLRVAALSHASDLSTLRNDNDQLMASNEKINTLYESAGKENEALIAAGYKQATEIAAFKATVARTTGLSTECKRLRTKNSSLENRVTELQAQLAQSKSSFFDSAMNRLRRKKSDEDES